MTCAWGSRSVRLCLCGGAGSCGARAAHASLEGGDAVAFEELALLEVEYMHVRSVIPSHVALHHLSTDRTVAISGRIEQQQQAINVTLAREGASGRGWADGGWADELYRDAVRPALKQPKALPCRQERRSMPWSDGMDDGMDRHGGARDLLKPKVTIPRYKSPR